MRLIALVFVIILLYSCASNPGMRLTSTAFQDGKPIPAAFTCDGADQIPPLQIADVPANARSLALVMDDPDAPMGTWDHWVVWNIQPATTIIDAQLGVAGKNSWGRTDYGGPCPPSGTHRYYFKLYALDALLDLPAGSNKASLLQAMHGHVIAEATLRGTYQRRN